MDTNEGLSSYQIEKQTKTPDPLESGLAADYSREALLRRVDTMSPGNRQTLFNYLALKGIDEEIFRNIVSQLEREEDRKTVASILSDFRMYTDMEQKKALIKELAHFLNSR